MRHRRNRGIQFGGAPAFGDQEAKEHPQCRRACLGRCPPTVMALLENKPPQALYIESAWIFADPCQQIPNRALVVVEGRIAGSAVLAHPLYECGDQRRIRHLRFGKAGTAGIPSAQKRREQTRPSQQLSPIGMAVSLTSTPLQVAAETLNDLFVHRLLRPALIPF